MRLSPDQERAIEQADIAASMASMPTYTTLLMFVEEIRDLLRDCEGWSVNTLRGKCRKALDETDFEPVFKQNV